MLKKFFIALAIALAVILVLCWIYLPSITRYRELKSEEERLDQKIQEIDAQIKTLTDERHLLQTDVAYLEKVIREELGFVKPGEIVYELVTKKNPSNPPPAFSETSSASDKKGTSVAGSSASEKARMSPVAVVASLANATPKVSKKKTSRSVA
ncbi:MAG: septum formation initiator family protein [Candidatus Omnitrophota bacterium]|jgi:cell division protein FtsB